MRTPDTAFMLALVPIPAELVRSGAVDPAGVPARIEPLMSAIDAYKAFDARLPEWIRIKLQLSGVPA